MSLSLLVKLGALSALIYKRCFPNLNEDYIGQPIEECDLDLKTDLTTTEVIYGSQNIEYDFLFRDGASDEGDNIDYPLKR